MIAIGLILFILPVLACIGYFFYKERNNATEWLAIIVFYYFWFFMCIYLCQDPDIKEVSAIEIENGIQIYEFSAPDKNCPWGGKSYCVIKTDSIKPHSNAPCIYCGQTYAYHGGNTYKDETDFNMSILADYAFSGNN